MIGVVAGIAVVFAGCGGASSEPGEGNADPGITSEESGDDGDGAVSETETSVEPSSSQVTSNGEEVTQFPAAELSGVCALLPEALRSFGLATDYTSSGVVYDGDCEGPSVSLKISDREDFDDVVDDETEISDVDGRRLGTKVADGVTTTAVEIAELVSVIVIAFPSDRVDSDIGGQVPSQIVESFEQLMSVGTDETVTIRDVEAGAYKVVTAAGPSFVTGVDALSVTLLDDVSPEDDREDVLIIDVDSATLARQRINLTNDQYRRRVEMGDDHVWVISFEQGAPDPFSVVALSRSTLEVSRTLSVPSTVMDIEAVGDSLIVVYQEKELGKPTRSFLRRVMPTGEGDITVELALDGLPLDLESFGDQLALVDQTPGRGSRLRLFDTQTLEERGASESDLRLNNIGSMSQDLLVAYSGDTRYLFRLVDLAWIQTAQLPLVASDNRLYLANPDGDRIRVKRFDASEVEGLFETDTSPVVLTETDTWTLGLPSNPNEVITTSFGFCVKSSARRSVDLIRIECRSLDGEPFALVEG